MSDCCENKSCRCHRFAGRAAIVTGAASGIGRACAIWMAREGGKVAICDINAEGLEETRRLAAEQGAPSSVGTLRGEIVAAALDVRSQEQVESFVQSAIDKFGAVDILVNNAGTGQFVPFAMMPNEEYDRVMDINVRSIFYFSRAVLPGMMDRDYGKIVNITSIVSLSAAQGQSVYSASKGAAKMLTQGIAMDCSGYHINVNAVAPGMILTGLTKNMLGDPDQAATFIEHIPGGRIGTPDDIAAAVCFLASDEASYIHGTTLVVDGGMLTGNIL